MSSLLQNSALETIFAHFLLGMKKHPTEQVLGPDNPRTSGVIQGQTSRVKSVGQAWRDKDFGEDIYGDPNVRTSMKLGRFKDFSVRRTPLDMPLTRGTFRIFFFLLLGRGELGARGFEKGGGRFFIENPRGGGGVAGQVGGGGREAGRVFAGNLAAEGGGAKYFFSGRKGPPSLSLIR